MVIGQKTVFLIHYSAKNKRKARRLAEEAFIKWKTYSYAEVYSWGRRPDKLILVLRRKNDLERRI